MRFVGTTSRGIRCPILKNGDEIVSFVTDAILKAQETEKFAFHNKDVVCVTESLLARSQGNYCTCDHVAMDIKKKFPEGVLGIYNPILSRNRFSLNLKGIARGAKKLYIQLTYPNDEVGNQLVDPDAFYQSGINPWSDILDEKKYREVFGEQHHPFTGIDYVDLYREIVEAEGCEVEFLFANNPIEILKYTKNVLTCDIHTRKRTKKILADAGCERLYNLEDVLKEPIDGSGYNKEYGLLGSNKASEESMKLFPRDCHQVVQEIQQKLYDKTNVHFEVMIYGDGAFKDPVGKIWELADPVVSPGFTNGLIGLPNEIKIKFLADDKFSNLSGKDLEKAIEEEIAKKNKDLKGDMSSEGTTPRQLTDLLGSLADLTSGSGDKGTPIVLIQGYFDSYIVQ